MPSPSLLYSSQNFPSSKPQIRFSGSSFTLFPDERAVFIFCKCSLQLFFCIHNNRTTPGNWFTERFSGEVQKPGSHLSGIYFDRCPVAGIQGYHAVFLFFVPVRIKNSRSRDNIGSCRISRPDWKGELHPRFKCDIEIIRVRNDITYWTSYTVDCPADNFNNSAIGNIDMGYIPFADLLVSWIHHLMAFWEVDPELKSSHLPLNRFWHFLVDNP